MKQMQTLIDKFPECVYSWCEIGQADTRIECYHGWTMGSAESDLADGQNSSTAGSSEGGDQQPRAPRTTRTHLLCLSRAHNKFAIQLYQEFAKDGKRPGNFVICPVGVSLGLGMLYLGSKSSSLDELHKVLHLQEVQEHQLLPAFAAMHWDVTRSAQSKGCHLEVAIRLFVQSGHFMVPTYESTCSRFEIARIKNTDFRNRPDIARKEINQWCEERTHGRIKDVIPMGVIDRDTSLLLLCAAYTRLHFLHPFDKKRTTTAPFYLHLESPQVQMMYQRHNFRMFHHNKLDFDMLELPLSNGYSKLLILLSKKTDGVSKIEMKLSRTILESSIEKLQDELVDVYLPKFRYELGIICWDALMKLGCKNLYASGKADFSGLDGTNSLYLSRAFHHLCIEIDEGVSDGGSSSGGMTTGGAGHSSQSGLSNNTVTTTDDNVQQVPKVFRADHPFLFLVSDDRTGAILFIGRVARPLQSSSIASVT